MLSDHASRHVFLPALASFVQLVLEGRTPTSIRPFFFGANLTALLKKQGGVKPIAVSCTLRRLVAKVAGSKVMEEMGDLLAPQQLGFGVKGGAEAAVHALRLYLCDPNPGKAVLKLDFKNAFNSIRRYKMLDAVRDHVPELHPFVHSAYSLPSSLFWSNKTIQSAEGVQQGDPLGPLLFCLSIHHMGTQLESDLSLLYLDDGTLGGSVENLRHDLEVVEREGARMGLQLSREKSEIICDDPDTVNSILQFLPGAQIVDPAKATLLGSPVGDVSSISDILMSKTDMLRRMGDRLQLLPAHDAILLLKHCFALPKLLYNLRTAPCFLSPVLQEYDGLLKSSLSGITNIHFGEDDPAWTQATLPVKMGGLGVRSAVQLAPSAFLASAVAASDLVHPSSRPISRAPPFYMYVMLRICGPRAMSKLPLWAQHNISRRPGIFPRHLPWLGPSWRAPLTPEPVPVCLHLQPRSRGGAWLQALPITSLGLRMDDGTIRVAAGLRLGAPLCRPHFCHHCGAEVDSLATRGLSCRWSEGRHHRHAEMNDIIHRALASAKVPSRLEPSGLCRTDGRRPDGVTVVPWRSGKLLVWDATCPDTFAPSYSMHATKEAGAVAALAEERKVAKYMCLSAMHTMTPVAIETSGVFGPQTMDFLKDLGRRVTQTTGEERSTTFLLQRLSVAVQRGNAASVLGTTGLPSGGTSID